MKSIAGSLSVLLSFVLLFSFAFAATDAEKQADQAFEKYLSGYELTAEEKNLTAARISDYEAEADLPTTFLTSSRSVLSEGFEGAFPPAGWTIVDGDGGSAINQTFSYIPAHGGTYGAQAMGCADDWLITPKLSVSSGDNSFSFWYGQESSSYANSFKVLVSTTTDDTAAFVQIADYPSVTPSVSDEWNQVTLDLSAYDGQDIYVAFYVYYSQSTSWDFGFDDVLGPEVYVAPTPPVAAGDPSPADAATGIAVDSDLTWSGVLGANGYKISLGTDNPPTNIENASDLTNVSTYTPASLDYETTYYWSITPYNDYGDATTVPVWSFTTEVDPTLTPPFTEDFDGFLGSSPYSPPLNWTKFTGMLEDSVTLTSTTYGWLGDDFGNNTSNTISARLNIYGSTRKHWLVTPPINLGTESYQAEFDLAYTTYSGTAEATLGVDDTFAVVISVDNGATWLAANALRVWDSTTPISNVGERVVLDLSAYTGTVKLGFYGHSTASNVDNNVFVDNFTVQTPPLEPILSLGASDVDFGSVHVGNTGEFTLTLSNFGGADLNVTDITSTDAAFTVDAATAIVAPTQSGTVNITFTPAAEWTDYSGFLVITSDAASSPDTVTLAGEGLPAMPSDYFTTSFEPSGDLPEGWTSEAQYSASFRNHSGSYSRYFSAWGSPPQWMMSQRLDLSAGDHDVFFWWNETGTDNDDSCLVEMSSDGGTTWSEVGVVGGGNDEAWTLEVLSLGAPASDNVFVRWTYLQGTGTNNSLYIDDVSVPPVYVPPMSLFFSEYIEGSSNNKGYEIYNPTASAISLDDYQIGQTSNGSDTTVWEYFHTFPAGASVAPGDVWVITTNEAFAEMQAVADEVLSYPSVTHHNGDDARGLLKIVAGDTTVVDLIGVTGPDPGTGWDVAGVTNATANHTLVRKSEVIIGSTDWAASAGIDAASSQWVVLPQNFINLFGVHPHSDYYEPNNGLATAFPVDADVVYTAAIEPVDDLDFFSFEASAFDLVTVFHSAAAGNLDGEIAIFDADSVKLISRDSGYSGGDESITDFELGAAGTYYVVVGYYGDVRASEGPYDISISLTNQPTGSVSGTITDFNTGLAIEGALVEIGALDLFDSTGADGVYNLGPMPAADYLLDVFASGYQPTSAEISVIADTTLTVDAALSPMSLFFSEYIEGSGNNKAFEIFNPTSADVDLADYIVLGNYNGNPYSDTLRFPVGTILAGGDVYVVAHLDADSAITAVADSLVQNPYAGGTSYMTVFNGDDVRGLFQVSGADTSLIDIIGLHNLTDPGSGWDVAGVTNATANHTLARKPGVLVGNSDWALSAGTEAVSSEWIVLPQDRIGLLGSHPHADYYEPNNSLAEAFPLSDGAFIHSVIDPDNDLDFFSFYGQVFDLVDVSLVLDGISSELGGEVALLDADSSVIATSGYNYSGNDVSLDAVELPAAGTYYLVVGYYSDVRVSTGEYELTLSLTSQETGSVAGVITDISTTLALEGAVVTIEGRELTDTTGADGTYAIGPFPVGLYELSVAAEGYFDTQFNLNVIPDSVVTLDASMTLVPAATQVYFTSFETGQDTGYTYTEATNGFVLSSGFTYTGDGTQSVAVSASEGSSFMVCTPEAAGYDNNENSWWMNLTDSDMDLTGLGDASVTMKVWHMTESGWDHVKFLANQPAVDGGTYYILDINGDGVGSTSTDRLNGDSGGWIEVTADLTPWAGLSGVEIAVWFDSDGSQAGVNNKGFGVAIDSVVVTGHDGPALVPPANLTAVDFQDGTIPLTWDAPVGGERVFNTQSIALETVPVLNTKDPRRTRKSVVADAEITFSLDANNTRALRNYNVFRLGEEDALWSMVGTTDGTEYTDAVSNYVVYSYAVTAVYDEGESNPSNIVTAGAGTAPTVSFAPDSLAMEFALEDEFDTLEFVLANDGGYDLVYDLGYVPVVATSREALLDENFDSGIPETWTIVDGGSSVDTWMGITDVDYNLDGTPYAICDSDVAGSVDMDEALITPVVNPGDAIGLVLHFDHRYRHYSQDETGDVDVWDGTQWVTVASFDTLIGEWYADGSPDHQAIDLTPYMNDSLRVKFHYYDAYYDYYWAIDNVKIEALNTVAVQLDPMSGVIEGGVSDTITVAVQGFSAGMHRGFIQAMTNDPVNPVADLPFSILVTTVNTPPPATMLVLPVADASVTLPDLEGAQEFIWSPVSDPDFGQTATYLFELVLGSETWNLSMDSNSVKISNQEIYEAIFDVQSQTSLTGTWTVYTTDGVDTTATSSGSRGITFDLSTVAVDGGLTVPEIFALHQNYPNPFNPTTTIAYDIPKAGIVRITIYNLLGQKVRTLVNSEHAPAYYRVQWNGTTDSGSMVASGMYIYRIESGDFSAIRKLVIMK